MVSRKLREVILTMQEENERDYELVLAFCRAEYQKQLDKKLSALVHCAEQQRNRATYTTNMASASSYSQQIPGQLQRSNSISNGSPSHRTPCAQRSNSTYTEAVAMAAPLTMNNMTNRNRNSNSNPSFCGGGGGYSGGDQTKKATRRGDLTLDSIAQRSSLSPSSTAALSETMQTPATGETIIIEHCNSTDSATTAAAATATRRIDPISQLPEWQRDVITMKEEELTKANLVDVIHRLYRESTAVPNTWTHTLQQEKEKHEREKEQQHQQEEEQYIRAQSTLTDHISPERASHFMSSLARGVGGGTATITTVTGATTSSSAGGGGGGMAAGRNAMSKEQVMAELRRLYGLEDAENGEKMDE
ncbi:hypothetical protein LSM04_009209 [Trypanosoma melophagium]|uniref:uncharacterized protein n=1 Tax=Trypanosoma melophagium TaxID=715481 RepID=UPI00351A3CE3|nr:hypothetical protein LSM04_009209 [Trypanosoma melophagium]